MKTRIISGIVLVLVVGTFISLGLTVSAYFITAFIAFLCIAAVYELLHNVAGIKSTAITVWAMVYAGIISILSDARVLENVMKAAYGNGENTNVWKTVYSAVSSGRAIYTIIYFIVSAFIILRKHKDFNLASILVLTIAPRVICVAFSYIGNVVMAKSGLYYLLLMLNFACICDTGAYFTGVTLGKHKLCPEISPKKTVEGAVGGIVSSLIFSVIIMVIFNAKAPIPASKVIATLIFTVPLCIVGMLGDLFASQIKRSVGLKDYSDLIPGHGGILDRFDSMLFIAPVLYCLSVYGVI